MISQHIEFASRAHLVEQVMALFGRSSSRPRQLRSRLERMTLPRLRRVHNACLERPFSQSTN